MERRATHGLVRYRRAMRSPTQRHPTCRSCVVRLRRGHVGTESQMAEPVQYCVANYCAGREILGRRSGTVYLFLPVTLAHPPLSQQTFTPSILCFRVQTFLSFEVVYKHRKDEDVLKNVRFFLKRSFLILVSMS